LQDIRSAFRTVTSQYFSLVASPAYLAARGAPKTLLELAAHDCLTVSSRQSRVTWTLQGPEGDEEVKVAGRFSANSSRILMKSCLAGLGVALLPAMLITAELRAGRLVHVLPDYRREGADFNIILPSGRQIPAAVSAFVEFATERLRSVVLDDLASTTPARRRKR
jgi:DNA-binding transcriptional LysR family regulator